MNTRSFISLSGSIISALGLLVLMFTALSSATAASDVITPDNKTLNELTSDRWRILADMQSGRGDPGVVVLNNKIHVVSGYFSPGFGYSSSQEVYDPQTNTWQNIWGFPVPRSDMVVVTVGSNIYAIGGWELDLGGVQGYNHMYDPTLNTWITRTSMITPVSGAGGVVLSDTIYVIGGYNGIDATRHVQVYDTVSDTWSVGTPLSTPRSELGAVVLNGLIYAIGGTSVISDVEIFDPAANEWSIGTPLPEKRYSMAVVERQGDIYVIGGTQIWNSGIAEDTMFIYDPDLDVWSLGNPMPTARSTCDATVISDTIYVLGGRGEPGAGTANEAYADFDIITTTTQILGDAPDPSQAFQPITVSFQVTSALIVPTGIVTVTVNQNEVKCSELLIGGLGNCGFNLDTPGIYTVTATYSGDDFFSGSSDNESHIVAKTETTTTIVSDEPDPSLQGQPFIVTYGVSSTFGSPSGVVTVTVSPSQESCSNPILGGVGSCEITLDAPGVYTLTAVYAGDSVFINSSDSAEHSVVDMFRLYLPDINKNNP